MKTDLIDFIGRELLSGRLQDSLSEHDDLLGSGLLDSLGIMQLVAFIEDDLGVEVPPEDVTIDHFQTVAKIEAYLKRGR